MDTNVPLFKIHTLFSVYKNLVKLLYGHVQQYVIILVQYHSDIINIFKSLINYTNILLMRQSTKRFTYYYCTRLPHYIYVHLINLIFSIIFEFER